jgi:hypothetical protein
MTEILNRYGLSLDELDERQLLPQTTECVSIMSGSKSVLEPIAAVSLSCPGSSAIDRPVTSSRIWPRLLDCWMDEGIESPNGTKRGTEPVLLQCTACIWCNGYDGDKTGKALSPQRVGKARGFDDLNPQSNALPDCATARKNVLPAVFVLFHCDPKTPWQETVAGNGSTSQTLVSKVPRTLVCRNRR